MSSSHEEIVVPTDNEVVCSGRASVLSAMQADDKFCDVVLRGVPPSGGSAGELIPIRAHKNILGYSSKHLYELFTSENYTDSHQSEFNIENVSHETLGLIVKFMYTGKFSTNEIDEVCRLLTGAKYLVMPKLAEACEKFLAGEAQISVDNCITLWCFARKYSCLELMHATSTFIAKNIRGIPENAQFVSMPFADCAKLLMSEAFIAANDDLRCSAAIAWLDCGSSGDRDAYVRDVLNMVPFKPGSMSIDTIIKAGENQLLRKRASEEMLDLVIGVFKRIKQDLPGLNWNNTSGRPSSRTWYVVGGLICPKMFLSYDVDRRLWSNLPSLPIKRVFLGACAAANRLIVLGGYKNGPRSADIDEFNLKTKNWTSGSGTLQTSRSGSAVCCYGLHAYAIGGFGGDIFSSVEQYNLQSNETRTLSSMNLARYDSTAVFDPVRNSIYVAGGFSGTMVSGIEKYDISANKWSQVGSLKVLRGGLGAALSGEDLYCIGGNGGVGGCKDVEIFNVRTGQTRAASNLLESRDGCSATTISDGNVICVLGGNSPTVECYDVRVGKWTTGVIVPDMPEYNRYFGFATV